MNCSERFKTQVEGDEKRYSAMARIVNHKCSNARRQRNEKTSYKCGSNPRRQRKGGEMESSKKKKSK